LENDLMKAILLAAALLALGLGACSDGDIDQTDVENAADRLESAGENVLDEGSELLNEAGPAIENTADEAGDAVENAARETGQAIENAGREVRE
jgi:hypothetical protein